MAINEHAGRPAEPSMLVDVDRLVRSYFEIRPDPSDPAQRVAFGTSGHRGSSLNGAFNEAHIAATTEAICRYRAAPGNRRAAVHRPRHPRAVRAGDRDCARGAGRARRRDPGRRRRRLHADPGHLARDPRPQPRSTRAPGRRDRRHAVAQPARGRRLQVQPAQRRPGRHRRHDLDPGRGERAPRSRPRRRPTGPPRAGPRPGDRATTTSAATSATSTRSSTWTPSADPACGSAWTRSAARASPTGRPSPSATGST